MSNRPRTTGPHWFLPYPKCEESKRYKIRIDCPTILHVCSWDSKDETMVVDLPEGRLRADVLSGDWEPIIMPKRMRSKVARRKQQSRDKANR